MQFFPAGKIMGRIREMEGYKSFIQAMDDASNHCSIWTDLQEGETISYEELMEAAFFTDGLAPLPDEQWWVAMDDGTVGLLNEFDKQILIMYTPVKSAPVTVKYTGEELERKLADLMPQEGIEDNPVFCIKCGTKLPAGAVFCPKCGHKVREG